MKKLISLLLACLLFVSFPFSASAFPYLEMPDRASIDAIQWRIRGFYASTEEPLSAWDVLALSPSGLVSSEAFEAALPPAELLTTLQSRPVSLTVPVLALLAAGENPTTYLLGTPGYAVYTPAAAIAGAQSEDGSFGASTNLTVYAILALEALEFPGYDREGALSSLLRAQLPDGGFALMGDEGDVDMTAMALLALSRFPDDARATAAAAASADFIFSQMSEGGGFVSPFSESGKENSNSVAAAISGLEAVRLLERPEGLLMLNNLSGFLLANGGFAYEEGDTEMNLFATSQALIALDDIYSKSFLDRFAYSPSDTDGRVSDLSAISFWALEYVRAALELDVMQGRASGAFDPKGTLTRAELAAMLCRIALLETPDELYSFADVSPTDWFYDDVMRIRGGNIMFGEDDSFRPDDPATREEIADAIARLMKLSPGDISPSDIGSLTPERQDSIRAVAAVGIMSGDPSGTFRPADRITREEAAKVMSIVAARYSKRLSPVQGGQ